MAATRGLHGLRYTDPEYARRERELLLHSWQLVCHTSDLPAAGTAMRCDFAGRSAFVVRGRDGSVRAFLNTCRHRGSRLVDGDPHTGLAFCVNGRLRCPYHGWQYDDAGALAEVPGADRYPGLDRAALALPAVAVESCLGFVFVAFEPPARSIAAMLDPVRSELEAYRFESLRRIGEPGVRRCMADWKLICEHQLDASHGAIARPSLKPMVGRDREFAARGADVCRMSARVAGEDAASWSARAYDRWLPPVAGLPAELSRLWCRYFLWPNLVLDVYPEQLITARVLPLRAGEALLRTVAYASADASREMRLARYLNRRVSRQAAAVDRTLVERTQQGIATGDYVPGPLAQDESGLRWFVERVRRAMPEPGAAPARAMLGRPPSRPSTQ